MNKDVLVFEKHKDLYTTSDVVAVCADIEHRSVRRTLENNIEDLSVFGRVRFEITPLQTKGGIQDTKIYLLNEQQAYLLMTYLKNTKPVREFKKLLVAKFFAMRQALIERSTLEWKQQRQIGKLTRRAETDVLQKLVEYAKAQGSSNHDKLYMTYSSLVKKLIGYESRDTATHTQLNVLTVIEGMILNTITECMGQDMHYKEIYKVCKSKLLAYIELTYYEKPQISVNKQLHLCE